MKDKRVFKALIPVEIKDGKLSLHKLEVNYRYTNLFFKK